MLPGGTVLRPLLSGTTMLHVHALRGPLVYKRRCFIMRAGDAVPPFLLYPYAGQAHYDSVSKDPRRVAERNTGGCEQQAHHKRNQKYAPSHSNTSFH